MLHPPEMYPRPGGSHALMGQDAAMREKVTVARPRLEGQIMVRDDRRLGFAAFGTPHGRPIFWFHGTPGARRQIPVEARALAEDLGRPSAQVLPQEITGAAVRRARSRHPDLKVTADVVFEEPGDALVRASRNASALVVGNRGRSGLAEVLLGSVRCCWAR